MSLRVPTCVTMERSMRQQTRQQSAAVISRRSEPAPGWGNRSRMPVMKPSTPTNCGIQRGQQRHGVLSPSPSPLPYLAVQSQHQEHEEEERGPQRGQGHQRHGFGVGNEGQPGACRDSRVSGAIPYRIHRARSAHHSPDSATLEISTPCSEAMKPSTENTTKPAKKLVELLMTARM